MIKFNDYLLPILGITFPYVKFGRVVSFEYLYLPIILRLKEYLMNNKYIIDKVFEEKPEDVSSYVREQKMVNKLRLILEVDYDDAASNMNFHLKKAFAIYLYFDNDTRPIYIFKQHMVLGGDFANIDNIQHLGGVHRLMDVLVDDLLILNVIMNVFIKMKLILI